MDEVGITINDMVDNYPQLFHMANAGSWPTIQEHGLLTTSDIVQTANLPLKQQEALLRQRRPGSTFVQHPVIGAVSIRDQAPLREQFLAPALTDMSSEEWLEVLNGRVFFWLHPRKLATLLGARRYRNHDQDVLTVDTRSLVEAYADQVRLSPMNSGATLYPNAPARGSGTFMALSDYPYADRRRRHGVVAAVTELAVVGGVPDIASHVVSVDRYHGENLLNNLFHA